MTEPACPWCAGPLNDDRTECVDRCDGWTDRHRQAEEPTPATTEGEGA